MGRWLGEQVGTLYGSNAAGAIVGTLAAGLYPIPTLGMRGSFLVAAGLNVAIGLSAIALSFVAARQDEAASPATVVPPPAVALTDPQLRIILGVFALSGAVTLALEVVWFRVLTLFLRPTV